MWLDASHAKIIDAKDESGDCVGPINNNPNGERSIAYPGVGELSIVNVGLPGADRRQRVLIRIHEHIIEAGVPVSPYPQVDEEVSVNAWVNARY